MLYNVNVEILNNLQNSGKVIKMKRIFALIIIIALVFSLASCELFYTNKKHTHSPVQYRAKSSTCVSEGNIEHYICQTCGKVFSDFRCTVEVSMSDVTLPLGDHTWVGAKCTSPKTCTSCGETAGEELGHNWKDANCVDPIKCARCGITDGDALGHLFDDACDPDCNREGCNEIRDDVGHVDDDNDGICDICEGSTVPDDDIDLPLDDF